MNTSRRKEILEHRNTDKNKKVNAHKNCEKRRVTCVYNGTHRKKWERTLPKHGKLITLIKIKLHNEV
jgi:hypothetical protein